MFNTEKTNSNPTNLNSSETLEHIFSSSEIFLSGKKDRVKLGLCNFLAQGHTLIEDLPGVGKTTLVKFFSEVFDLKMSRIQFTNDLLPSDILGSQIFNRENQSFHFHPGPIFGAIIMADELNRAPPKTQSALLQAMEEKKVTVDGESMELDELFHVIATQNPRAQIGTFDLPESQLDRFSMKFDIGYPDQANTLHMLKNKTESAPLEIKKKVPRSWIHQARAQIEKVTTSEALYSYIFRLLDNSRIKSDSLPLSNRCGIDLVKTSKAWAWLNKEDFVSPDHIQFLFPYVAGHRLSHPSNSDISREKELAKEILKEVNVRP